MFDINGPEFIILVVLAVIVFGPERLPELARKAARVLNYVRNIANDAQGRLRAELGTDLPDLSLADLNPRALVTSALIDPVRSEFDDIRATVTEAASATEDQSDDEDQDQIVTVAPVFDAEAT